VSRTAWHYSGRSLQLNAQQLAGFGLPKKIFYLPNSGYFDKTATGHFTH
jgi:hypothetical protein